MVSKGLGLWRVWAEPSLAFARLAWRDRHAAPRQGGHDERALENGRAGL
jgi:hypothetical protein